MSKLINFCQYPNDRFREPKGFNCLITTSILTHIIDFPAECKDFLAMMGL